MQSVEEQLAEAVERLSKATRLTEVSGVVRRVARQLSDADGVTFILRDGDRCYYADESAIGPLWKGKRFPLKSCISGWVMTNRQPVAIPDIYADPRIPHATYRPTFVKSLAMVPVRESDPIAAIGAYWATNHLATSQELGILEVLANASALALSQSGYPPGERTR